jgi:hypothetical protein
MNMDDLLKNRWAERNRELNERIQGSQGGMNARGVLQSSMAVQALHEIFSEEFVSSRATIVSTVSDSLNLGAATLQRKNMEQWALDQLRQRQKYLDRYFLERSSVSMRGLTNEAVMAGYGDVARYFNHASQELRVELNAAFNDYENSFGATLYDRVLNNFKNHPVIVIGAVSVVVLVALFGLYSAIIEVGS